MKINLAFANPISEAYREKLQTFSDYVFAQGITENRAPIIEFPGMNRKKFDAIVVLHRDYSDRNKEYYLYLMEFLVNEGPFRHVN